MVLWLSGPAHSQPREHIQETIHRTEDVLDDLDDDFKDGLKKTSLHGTRQEEHLGKRMEALEDAFDVVRKRFNNGADYHELRGLLEEALQIAAEIDGVIKRYHFSKDSERDWSEVMGNLDTLARHYRLAGLPAAPGFPVRGQ